MVRKLLKSLALAGALALSSLSCSQNSNQRTPEQIFADRIHQYEEALIHEQAGLQIDHSQFKDVIEYKKTGKKPDYVTNPEAEKPVEQPQYKIKRVKRKVPGLFSTTGNEEATTYKWSVEPYIFTKRKFDDKDDIGPYNGAGFKVKRNVNDRFGVYGGLEIDSASDTQKTDISRAELKSTGTTLKAGVFYKPVLKPRFELELNAGAQLRHEENEGYIQVLDQRRNISDSETMGGWELGAKAKWTTTNKRFGAYVGPQLEEAGDSGLGWRMQGGLEYKF